MPGVPPDALAQVKRGLRSLFSRRKKKKQPPPPETTPSSNGPPNQASSAATPTPAPVEAPTSSKRSIIEVDNAPESEDHPQPSNSAADPTTTTAAPLMPNPPPLNHPTPASADLPNTSPSQPQPHIAVPSQIEEAKGIDLNPTRDIIPEASDVKIEAPSRIKPKLETGMSATSGPMGDHMAEVWRDSDVGAKEERPADMESKTAGVSEGVEGERDDKKF